MTEFWPRVEEISQMVSALKGKADEVNSLVLDGGMSGIARNISQEAAILLDGSVRVLSRLSVIMTETNNQIVNLKQYKK